MGGPKRGPKSHQEHMADRVAVEVSDFFAGFGLDQQLHHFSVSLSAGKVQRSPPALKEKDAEGCTRRMKGGG